MTRIAGELTWDGAGAVIGVTGNRIRAAADPDRDPRSPLNVEQCRALDAAFNDATGQGFPILEVYTRQVEALSPPRAGDPVKRLASAVKETSEAVQAFAAQAPHHELEREVSEAVTALNNLVMDSAAGLRVVGEAS